MTTNSNILSSADAFVRVVLATAADVEADERRIKQAILEAAERGDTLAVAEIVTRWQSMPAKDVLCPQAGSSPVD